jgi:hypothetical protein
MDFGMSVYKDYLYVFQGWSDLLIDQREIYKMKLTEAALVWTKVKYTQDKYDPTRGCLMTATCSASKAQ